MSEKNNMMKRATLVELICASILGVAMNAFTNFTNFFPYYLTGIVGVGTILAGSFITIFRLWDAFTDIGIGVLVDHTNTRIGKFRPWILAGAIISIVASGLLIYIPNALPESIPVRLTAFIILYMIFICGSTMYNPATRSTAQVLTDDPKQRATVGMLRGLSIQTLYAVLPIIVYSHIIPATKGFNIEFFKKYWVVYALITAVTAALGFFGFSKKDVYKEKYVKTANKFDRKAAWDLICHNRPFQMLILSAGSDKLATICQNNATVVVILYAIVAGNAKLNSGANKYTLIPCLLMIILGLGGIGRKFGAKKSMIFASLGGIVVCGMSVLLWIFGDPKTFCFPGLEGFSGWSGFTLTFLVLWCLYKGFTLVASNVTNPMIADVIDYEQYRSGNYVPGLIGSVFSFADKVISSLGPTLVSLMIAFIGFRDQLPTIDTPFSNKLFAIGLMGMYGMVIIGLIINLVAMKYYDLEPAKMEEIHVELERRKNEQ